MKKRQKQINIVIRYLCSQPPTKDGHLIITHNDIQLLFRKGCDLVSCLQELESRKYIKHYDHQISVPNPTTYEIELLPSCYKRFYEMTLRQRTTMILSIIAAISTTILTITGSLNNIVDFLSKITPQEKYEISTQWIDNQEALSLVTEKSKIAFTPTSSYLDCFYGGVSLFALFTNTTDVDREIVNFTISATDIVEDLSPHLSVFANQYENIIMLEVGNYGWSNTGEMVIVIENISPPRLTSWKNDQTEQESANSIANVILRNALQYSGIFSVEPGTQRTLPLMTTNAFDIIWKDMNVEKFYFDVTGTLYSLDIDYDCGFSFKMEASHDGVGLANDGMGGGDDYEINHVVVIDTSQENWTKTYPVYQSLPANQTIQLPIFIFPTKTCTMSLKVTFEMSDGETLEAQWLDNQRFIIPYYETLSSNLDDIFENWNDISNKTFIHMPE